MVELCKIKSTLYISNQFPAETKGYIVQAFDQISFRPHNSPTGMCYKAEICTILLLLRCPLITVDQCIVYSSVETKYFA